MQYFSSFPWRNSFISKFALLTVALFALIPLAACGGSSGSSGGTGTSSGPVNLTFWSWVPGIDKSIADFNSSHPNIHVKLANVGSGPTEYTKLYTAIKANNEPDLGQVEFQLLPTFEATGALVDMAPYGANDVKSQFVPWTWGQVSLGNAVYAIPQDSGPEALYYRADVFKKYNLPVPTTWAQYADDAAKLHAADPKEYITDFPPKEPGWFTGLLWQAGARPFSISGQSWNVNINSPAAQKVTDFWQGLLSKKLVATDPDFSNAWYNELQTGTVATWISAVWGANTIRSNAPQASGKWAIAPIPQWQAGQTVDGNWGGSTTVLFKSSQHPKEAAQFAIWLNTNQQSIDEMIKGASIYPAYAPSLDAASLNQPDPYYGNQVVGQIFKTASSQVDVNFQWGPTIDQFYADMGNDFANVVNGQGTLTSSLTTLQDSTVTFMKKQGFSVSTS